MFGRRRSIIALFALAVVLPLSATDAAPDDAAFAPMGDRAYFDRSRSKSWAFGVSLGSALGLFYSFDQSKPATGLNFALRFANITPQLGGALSGFYFEAVFDYRALESSEHGRFEIFTPGGGEFGVFFPDVINVGFVSGAPFAAITLFTYVPEFKSPSGERINYRMGYGVKFPLGMELAIARNAFAVSGFLAPTVMFHIKDTGQVDLRYETIADFALDLGVSVWVYLR